MARARGIDGRVPTTPQPEGAASGNGGDGGPPPSYPIGSVDNALRMLLMIGERSEVRVSDASAELGVAPSTAHRVLQMLQFHGFVRQDPQTKAYTAGPVWAKMALRGLRNLDIRTVARSHVEALSAETKETVQLMSLQGDGQMVCLDAVESPYVVRAAGRIGWTAPAYATAAGRAVLATLTPERVRDLYPGAKLAKIGPHTIATRAALETQLATVAQQGFAHQSEELEPGVSAIAAPIRGQDGVASFAVDVVMPTSRLEPAQVPAIAAAAVRTADAIATAIGL
jgi:IclR family acetate operon transcriptional repressor